MTTFDSLGLPAALTRVLASQDITEPFPIQEETIPDALAGRDISGRAPTGSGKTLAFGLPLLTRVEKGQKGRPRALVLAPTRELAEQIKEDLTPLARSMDRWIAAIYGGVSYGPQRNALRKGVDILVATPGRLEDLIEQGAVNLRDTDIVVIDEADRMADMGFMPAVKRILDGTAKRRQTLLFSATLDGDIATLSRDYQTNPVRHDSGSVDDGAVEATHHFWLVQHHDRIQHAADLIDASDRSIVFTRTRHGADRLAKQLGGLGIRAVSMHGGRSQSQRNRALSDFSSGRARALIATDVAARGIHVDDVSTVVHFDPPADAKDYLHRSGRTARAGAPGTVVSLVTGDQKRAVTRMQRDLGLPSGMGRADLDALDTGGARIGDPAPPRRAREDRSSRPTQHADRAPRRERSTEPVRDDDRGNTSSTDQRGKKADSIYIANLPWETTADDVERLFGRFGKVHQATVIVDKRTGRSKGFGFVDMPHAAASTAIDELHNSQFDGREITVRFAKPRTFGS